MATTIQIKNQTMEILQQLRKQSHARSYDEVIQYMIRKATALDRSYAGFLGKKSKKQILKGLRDKDDRI